uniref:ATP synthase CF0 B' subunit n=1 Tax=Cyanoptyche gloeocystis TaxID=77922 RepID=A0A3G1IWK0_9EUKA|nr:ATP synthase CF0 B' subunit [Cyanoptyche gloeocystis]
MVIFMKQYMLLLAEGGLFDFDATLPLMIVQLITLMLLLNIFFYKPFTKILDERNKYIQSNLTLSQSYLLEAEQLKEQYDKKVVDAKQQSAKLTSSAKTEMQELISKRLSEAQTKANTQIEAAKANFEMQRQQSLKTLEPEIQVLSLKIFEKLIGTQLKLFLY